MALIVGTAVASALLTYLVWRSAVARGILDIPNERSSHSVPTPRGGGIAIFVCATLAFLILRLLGRIDLPLLVALLGGAAVAAIGLADDRRPLRASIRLTVHFAAALWAMLWLGGVPPLAVGEHVIDLGTWGYGLGVLGIVWTLNLFNFMDGIDGIAASEAVFVSGGATVLALLGGGFSAPAAVFAAACCGFLVWNWPPARIFMGDVGSGYLGYIVAVLAVADGRRNPAAVWIWLILGGAFFADATVTLVRRLLRGERPHVAHRSHAYQWLARRWRSHGLTTSAVTTLNLVWLLPCAWLAGRSPGSAPWMLATALGVTALLAALAGAGRQEAKPDVRLRS